MADKRDRDPFDARYDDDSDDSDAESSKTSKRTNTAETAERKKSDETAESGGVRERRNVNMYLPDGLVDNLQLRYSELNVQWRREHGEDLPKNDQFYPAVIEAALQDTSIEDELGLEDDSK
jgi:hypothetical protein